MNPNRESPEIASLAELYTEAIPFWKGRVALYAILKAYGVGAGDAVIVPGYTCVVVPTAIKFAGAVPIYADIDPQIYSPTLANVEKAAEDAAARDLRIKAVILQHTYGIPADAGPTIRWAREHDVAVIEDCCHALGSMYRDDQFDPDAPWEETGRLGDAAFFSSQWSKPITTGLGGWAWTSHDWLRAELLEFAEQQCSEPSRWEVARLAAQYQAYQALYRPNLYWKAQGLLRRLAALGLMVGSSSSGELDVQMPSDYAKRMSGWQQKTARAQIGTIAPTVAYRQKLQALYHQALSAAGIRPFQQRDWTKPVLLRYPLRVENKNELLALARQERIELGDWFDHPLHPAGSNVAALLWSEGLCPQGERAAREVINLPMHARIDERELDRIVAFLANRARPAL